MTILTSLSIDEIYYKPAVGYHHLVSGHSYLPISRTQYSTSLSFSSLVTLAAWLHWHILQRCRW